MNALLIQSPRPDFDRFLILCEKLLDHNPAESADADPRRLSDTVRFARCLEGFRNRKHDLPNTAVHISLSFLVWAYDDLLYQFVELCDLPFITTETVHNQFTAAIITGTYERWELILQCDRPDFSELFDKIRDQLKTIGL